MPDNPFTQFLKAHKTRSFFLAAPGGNSGDNLLEKGLEQYLENNQYITTRSVLSADIILMHGGGNIDDVWHCGKELLIRLLREHPNKIIVAAPNTYHFFETDLEKIMNGFTQEIYLFAREKFSFARLKEMRLNANIHIALADDTAFLLEGTSYVKDLQRQNREEYTLFAFRTDTESRLLTIEYDPHRKDTILEKLKYVYLLWQIRRFLKTEQKDAFNAGKKIISDISHCDFDTFVAIVSHASKIYTDRLHVGILGALLGKKVHLYNTKYDKIDGVYDQSLYRYPHVVPMFHSRKQKCIPA